MTKGKMDKKIATQAFKKSPRVRGGDTMEKTQDILDGMRKEQVCEDSEDIRAKIAMLEVERVSKATQEIQEILDKYGVMLEAMAMIPASQINIVPRPSR